MCVSSIQFMIFCFCHFSEFMTGLAFQTDTSSVLLLQKLKHFSCFLQVSLHFWLFHLDQELTHLFSVWAMTYRGRYKFWIGQHCSTTKESLLIGCNVSLYQHNKQMCNLWWRASSNNNLLGDIIVCSMENYCHDAFSVFLHVV